MSQRAPPDAPEIFIARLRLSNDDLASCDVRDRGYDLSIYPPYLDFRALVVTAGGTFEIIECIDFFSAPGSLARRFKVRPCFYPPFSTRSC